jgi:hypothetical protein
MPELKEDWRKQMNKTFVFTVPISLILVACGGLTDSDANVCEGVVMERCTGLPPVVTINTYGKAVGPPQVCVVPGGTVTFKVTPVNGGVRTVATIPKIPTHFWLIGMNDPDPNGFELTAPDTEGEYNYTVVFADGHCIDPMIKVRDEI